MIPSKHTELITVADPEAQEEALKQSAEILRRGGLVVFPTETVYGLGGNGLDAEAAQKIYAAKGRPSDNPLIIHVAKPEDAELYAVTNSTYEEWFGDLTNRVVSKLFHNKCLPYMEQVTVNNEAFAALPSMKEIATNFSS